jgi:hypothetical protein
VVRVCVSSFFVLRWVEVGEREVSVLIDARTCEARHIGWAIDKPIGARECDGSAKRECGGEDNKRVCKTWYLGIHIHIMTILLSFAPEHRRRRYLFGVTRSTRLSQSQDNHTPHSPRRHSSTQEPSPWQDDYHPVRYPRGVRHNR